MELQLFLVDSELIFVDQSAGARPTVLHDLQEDQSIHLDLHLTRSNP